jgi:hypothetical protein
MIRHEDALKFAREWIEAWNSHDLAKILSHYSEDFALTTPYIVEVMKEPTGAIKGKKAVRDYWERAFQRIPDLHLDLIDCFPSVRSMVILYRTMLDRHAAEWLLFGDDGRVRRSIAHYSHSIVQTTLGHEEHEEDLRNAEQTIVGSLNRSVISKKFPFFVSFVLFVVKDFYVCSNPKLILVAAMLR